MLRNLDDTSIVFLTDKINESWKSGVVVAAWKTACTVLSPKPGKAPNGEHGEPLADFSKLLRRQAHGAHHPEKAQRDAMKLIKHQIADGRSRDVKALLGQDVEKASDSMFHTFIVNTISDLGLGYRFQSYASFFLTDRKAKLSIGDFHSTDVSFRGWATPQSTIISPALFSICTIGISGRLARVEDVKYTIYSDDIAIWCSADCEGRVEEAIQETIDLMEEYLRTPDFDAPLPSWSFCFTKKGREADLKIGS
ncbi:uncharacterized protein [Dermacentor albipictus]|uniref:uncharacterized protein n=1 Tax=Dermacentor albipictus TaxID=60249 RepID=UPI0038FC73AA